jgi:hypothetical protein
MPPKKDVGKVSGGPLETDPLYLFYDSLYREKRDASPMATEWLRKRDLLPKKDSSATKSGSPISKVKNSADKLSQEIKKDTVKPLKKKLSVKVKTSFLARFYCPEQKAACSKLAKYKTTATEKTKFSLSKFQLKSMPCSESH